MKTNHVMPIFMIFMLCVLCAADSIYAQNGTVQIECVGSDGAPLKDVEVTILPLTGTQSMVKKSNKEGIALFDNVSDGVYRIVGRKKDYAPALYEYLSIPSSAQSATLTLSPGLDSKLYFEDPAIIQRSIILIQEGINASKEGRYEDAENALIQANELDPSNVQALYYLGVFYIQTRDFDKATQSLEKASHFAKIFAALPPVEGKVDPATNQKIYDDAQTLIKNMLLLQSQIALQEKQYDKAVALTREATENDPNNPEAHFQLALALTYAEQYDEAIKSIETAKKLKPDEKKYTDLEDQILARKENADILKAQALLDEGNKLYDAGAAAEALAKYREALDSLSEDIQSPVWKQIGQAQVKLGQTEQAEAAYKKAVEFSSEKAAPAYLTVLAQFYINTKNYGKALDALTDPRALNGSTAEKALMDLFEKSRDKDSKLAEAALERIIKVNPADSDTYFLLGQMYYADGPEMDGRTKELLNKYFEIGQDEDKIGKTKDMLVIINRRSQ